MPKPFSAIPGPKGLPLIGSLLDYSRFGQFSFERMQAARRANLTAYGKIYKERLGIPLVHVFDPADVETVYRAEGKYPVRPPVPIMVVASKRENESFGFTHLTGEPWWRQRSVIQKSMMTPGAAHVYLPAQNQVADDFVKLISQKLDKGSGKLDEDITKLLPKYTMEAFGAVCFNVRIGCLEPTMAPDTDAYEMFNSLDKSFEAIQKTLLSFPWYAIFRTRLYRQFFESWTSCQRLAKPYVDEALKCEVMVDGQKVKGKNFLRTLVDTHSEKLTNKELIHMAIDLFGGGIDSTAYALSFCLYNLARNVDKQDRLFSEIDSILDSTSFEPVTPEVLNRMQYLKACVKESFRLNFPVTDPGMRTIDKDLVLSDYLVPKGTTVVMNLPTMCLMEEYFPHPDQYLPERWLKGEGDNLRPASSFFLLLPFGHGPRMCIGRRFAEQEIWLALIKIFQSFRLQLDVDASDHQPLGMINRIFTVPDAKIPLQFIPR